MKSFLKIIGGSLVGFLIGITLLVFIGFGIAASAGKPSKVTVKPNSVLHLNLAAAIPDRVSDQPFGNLDPFGLDIVPEIGLFELVDAIEHAKTNDHVKGIYLTSDFLGESFASLDQLRRSLEDFKSSGKFIIAYNNFSTTKSYHVSSVADALYAHPEGAFEFDGLGIETMYFKKLLDKLDIEPIPLYAGDYKSASEPYRRTDMSEENREQLHALLEDLYGHYLSTISAARGIPEDSLFTLADNLLVADPEDALAYGLIDGVAFEDEVYQYIREEMGYEEDDKIELVTAEDYLKSFDPPGQGIRERIAVVYAEGTIVLGEGSSDNIGGDKFMKLIRKLRKDDKVKAIVLRVNSPGGVAFSSSKIWRELVLAKEAKPLVVSMGSYAASGGYYISAMADRIYAEKNTVTGSIGVVGVLLNFEDFFNEKIGLTFDRENIGQYADFGNLARDWSDYEKQVAQDQVKRIYDEFKEIVAEGRGMTLEAVEAIAQGRVYTGQDALAIGLVDTLGGLKDAIRHAAELANLEEYRLRDYPQEKEFFQQLMEDLMETRSERVLKRKLGSFYDEFTALEEAAEWSGIQMRMPFRMEVH